jgi:predicted TIM-barrel fold metal-dependent hydrolase
MGFTHFREAVAYATLKKLGRASNVWFDISAIATTYVDSPVQAEFVWTMRTVGIDRILFGSDWPVDTPGVAAAAVRRLGLSEAEQRQVFHDNAAKLLGFDDKPEGQPRSH